VNGKIDKDQLLDLLSKALARVLSSPGNFQTAMSKRHFEHLKLVDLSYHFIISDPRFTSIRASYLFNPVSWIFRVAIHLAYTRARLHAVRARVCL